LTENLENLPTPDEFEEVLTDQGMYFAQLFNNSTIKTKFCCMFVFIFHWRFQRYWNWGSMLILF